MRQDGERLVIEPLPKRTLADALDYLASLPPHEDEFPEIEDFPPEPFDL